MSTSTVPSRTRKIGLRVLLLGMGVGALGWMHTSGIAGDLDFEGLRGTILAAGPWGALLFLLLFSVLQPLGLASHAFILAAAVVWPAPQAIALSWAGALGAGLVAFGFARSVAQEWVLARIPPRLMRWEHRLSSGGWRAVVLVRLLFFTTFFVQLLLGASRVRFRDFLIGTAIGNLPLIIAETLLAAQVLEWIRA